MLLPRFLVCAALVFAAGGCATVDMYSLENRYENLVETKVAGQRAATGTGNVASSLSSVAPEESMLALASDARALEGKVDAKASKIALLRLAALAGWQSGRGEGVAIANGAAERARSLCAGMDPAKEFRPARDCAIVQIMPMILSAETLPVLAQGVQIAPAGTPISNEQGERRLGYVREARVAFAQRLPGWNSAAQAEIGANEALGSWYEQSRKAYACAIWHRVGSAAVPPDQGLQQRLLDESQALQASLAQGLGADPAILC